IFRRYSSLADWDICFEIKPSSFHAFDPLPLLLNVLLEVPGLRNYSGTLYTLMAELYSNALEHGVLKLDSAMKDTPEGFTRYYQEREARLREVSAGNIRIHLQHSTSPGGGRLTMRVEDSGEGFDKSNCSAEGLSNRQYCGRGLALLDRLCACVRYLGDASEVEAVFSRASDPPVVMLRKSTAYATAA